MPAYRTNKLGESEKWILLVVLQILSNQNCETKRGLCLSLNDMISAARPT